MPDYLAALAEGVRGLRIGISPDYDHIAYPDTETGEMGIQAIQPEMNQAVREVAQVLASLGAEIVENVPMPNARHGIPTYFVISRVEAASNLHRFDGVKYGYRTQKPVQDLTELYRVTRAEGFGLQPKLRILMGMYVSAAAHSAHPDRTHIEEAHARNRHGLQASTLVLADLEHELRLPGDPVWLRATELQCQPDI